MLGKTGEADDWSKRAETRRQNVQKYLWDAKNGFYFDYNLDKKNAHPTSTSLPIIRCGQESQP